MKGTFLHSALLVLVTTFMACNEQVKGEKQTGEVGIVSEMIKIPVPENGFSNGYLDQDGSIWFTSNGGGIYHFDRKAFKNYTEKNGLNSNQVFAVVSDKKNNLWFGTQKGLTKLSGPLFEHLALPYQDTSSIWLDKMYPIINPNAVHSLATDNSDNLWIGTAGGGAYYYDGTTFTSYLTEIGQKQEDSLYHNWIPFIRRDNNGNIWFASMTHGGVHQFDGKEFTQYLIDDGLSDSQVRTIYCDRSGKIWMGFNGNRNSGLTVYDEGSFKSYSVNDGLCSSGIRSIYEDKNGKLWLGSNMGNLCIFDGQTFSDFNYHGQIFSEVVFILGDLEDNIWFGGANGIWKYDGETLTEMTIPK